MKLVLVVVTLSALSFCNARAEDANAKGQSAGSCMPIGLTASGEVVFPWDCRQIIEKQRGPVSLNVPNAASDASQKEQGQAQPDKAAQPDQTAVTATPAAPQPQLATAADHAAPAREAAATPERAAARRHPKRRLAAAPAETKKQPVAAQPQQPTSSFASSLMRAFK
jgi:hypothetical protein